MFSYKYITQHLYEVAFYFLIQNNDDNADAKMK